MMYFGEASARQQTVVARVVQWITRFLRTYREPRLTDEDWLTLLEAMYPHVEEARRESAEIGREFYDTQRYHRLGSTQDADLAGYDFEEFVEKMEPVRGPIVDPNFSEEAVAQAALRAAKEVEAGWRKTLIRAVQNDPAQPKWARVATGRETCGFCMMLVSRGPVYSSARTAGLDLADEKATELWNIIERSNGEESQLAEEALDSMMIRWHPGCDCRVVPVFNENSWVGRDAHLRAEALWTRVTKGLHGREAMNAFRRAVENGEIPLEQLATAA